MRHPTFYAAFLTEKLNLSNSISIVTVCGMKSYNKCSKCCLSALTV